MLGGCCRGGSHLAAAAGEVRLDCGCRIGDRSGSGRDLQQALGPTGSPEGRTVFQAPSGSFNARARHAGQKGLLTGSPRSSCRDSVGSLTAPPGQVGLGEKPSLATNSFPLFFVKNPLFARRQIKDPSSGKHFSLLFLPATPSSLSRTLRRAF